MTWKEILKAEWFILIVEGKGAGPRKQFKFSGSKQEAKIKLQETQREYPDARITLRRRDK